MSTSRAEHRSAILAMAAAVLAFAIMDAMLKYLSQWYGPYELSCLRCLSSLAILSPVLLRSGSLEALHPRQVGWHLCRAALGLIMLTTFVYAVRQMSLAGAYAIYLTAPLLITAISAIMLGDRVTVARWLAVIIGLCGVILILQPTSGGLTSLASIAAVVSAIAYSLSALTVPVLAKLNSRASIVFWFLALVGGGAAAMAITTWRAISLPHVGWLLGIGAAGAAGQYLITRAFQTAPPFIVAPLEYSSMLWAVAIDWIFWSKVPDLETILGSGLVMMSGLYVASRA
jgi:drug/metabolite transporter (DMT)-like permease